LSFIFAVERDGWLKEGGIAESSLDELEEATAVYWQTWLARCSYRGRWREMVQRSALLLQLLTYAPTGAIIAAPSCSLPEWVGGERNWDYRYNWIRDAANTVYALLRIGLFDEAALFMNWIEERCAELAEADSLQTVYSVDGSPDLHERTLAHLEGYRGSRPVRIGNDAFKQLQLDIYGALIDAVYLYNKYGQPITWPFGKMFAGWSIGCAPIGNNRIKGSGNFAETPVHWCTPR
jgi:GH15 family glucan-1,4-alpha-glucosidase